MYSKHNLIVETNIRYLSNTATFCHHIFDTEPFSHKEILSHSHTRKIICITMTPNSLCGTSFLHLHTLKLGSKLSDFIHWLLECSHSMFCVSSILQWEPLGVLRCLHEVFSISEHLQIWHHVRQMTSHHRWFVNERVSTIAQFHTIIINDFFCKETQYMIIIYQKCIVSTLIVQ